MNDTCKCLGLHLCSCLMLKKRPPLWAGMTILTLLEMPQLLFCSDTMKTSMWSSWTRPTARPYLFQGSLTSCPSHWPLHQSCGVPVCVFTLPLGLNAYSIPTHIHLLECFNIIRISAIRTSFILALPSSGMTLPLFFTGSLCICHGTHNPSQHCLDS